MEKNLRLPVSLSYAAAAVFVWAAWQYTHSWQETESARLFGDLCWILATGILVGALVSHGDFSKSWSDSLGDPWGAHRYRVSEVSTRRAKLFSVALLLASVLERIGVRHLLRLVIRALERLGV